MRMKRNVSEARVMVVDEARRSARVAHAKQDERNELLRIAQSFADKFDRQDPTRVMAYAKQLLAWLDESANDLDRSARMAALKKVEAASWGARHETLPASKLIEQASVYYRFIAA